MKSLERSHAAAQKSSRGLRSAIDIGGVVKMRAAKEMLVELDEYLNANNKLQMSINSAHGDTPRQIAQRAVTNKISN